MIAAMLTDVIGSVSRARNNLENPSVSLNDPRAYDYLTADSKSAAGISITHGTAMEVGAVWQAVSMISGDAAMCPFHVFKRLDKNFREIDKSHPAEFLSSVQPNDEMPAMELWRRHFVHALLWSDAYLYVERLGRVGEPIGLYNLLPDRTKPNRKQNGELFYETEVDGQKVPLRANEVIHTKGVCIENECGLDLVRYARDSWGLALAAQGFASKFFANGAGTGGILEIPIGFTEKAAKNLEEGFRKRTGPEEWFKTAILRDGAKFHGTTTKPRDAELTTLSEVQVRQVARFFNLPPFKLGLEDSNAYNSSEMAQLIYLASCLNTWLAALRGSASIKLLTEKQLREQTHFMAHNTSVIIETDQKTLNDVLAVQRQNKIINAQEWRAKLNLSPRTDADAESYENPNTDTGDQDGETPDGDDDAKPNGPTDAQRRLVRHALEKFGRRISHQVNGKTDDEWLKVTRQAFRGELRPAADVLAEVIGVDGAALCEAWEKSYFTGLATLLRPDNTMDRGEALGQLFPAALAARIGVSDEAAKAD